MEQVERASLPHVPIFLEYVCGEGDNKKTIHTSLYFPQTRTANSIACEGSRVCTNCTKLLNLLIVGNHNRLLRQPARLKHLNRDREAPPRGITEKRTGNSAVDSRVTASTAEGRVAALRTAGARRKSKHQAMPTQSKRTDVREIATSEGVRNILRV